MERLTYDQQRSVLSRFKQLHNYPSGRGCEYACRMCKENPATVKGPNWRIYPVWRFSDGSYSASGDYEIIEEIAKHLMENHELVSCNVCSELITRRGMKRHQNSPLCQAELRRFSMREKGYQLLESGAENVIPNIVLSRLTTLEKLAQWDDEDILMHLERSATAAQQEMIVNLGIRPCFTKWQPEHKKYTKEYWAPPSSALLLSLLPDFQENDEFVFSTLHQWIDGTDTTKESILALLEMKKEGAL